MQPETAALKKKLNEHFDHWADALEKGVVSKLDFTIRAYVKEAEQVVSNGTYSERHLTTEKIHR